MPWASSSLGCVPAQAKEDLGEFFELWRTKSITAWSDWLPEVDRAAERISKIISAPQGTVIMHQTVSTVMSVLASCFDYTPERNKVVFEATQFPTVSYVWHAEQRRGASARTARGVNTFMISLRSRACASPDWKMSQ